MNKEQRRKVIEARVRLENAQWWVDQYRRGAVPIGGAPTREQARRELEAAERALDELQPR